MGKESFDFVEPGNKAIYFRIIRENLHPLGGLLLKTSQHYKKYAYQNGAIAI